MLRKALRAGIIGIVGWCLLVALPAAGGESARRFRFLAVADTHFWELEKHAKSLEGFKAWLERVKPLGADFAVILGDVCGDRYAALPQARKIAEESGVKVYFVPGNHDDNYGNEPEHWEKAFGKFCDSFDHKGWHFVMHWSQKAQPKWLADDLAAVKPGTPVVFWQHYPPRHSAAVWNLLEKHGVKMVMSGHVHGLRTGMSGPVRDVTLDTFGTGFAVVDVMEDGRLAVDWRPRGVSRRLVVEHPADGSAVASGKADLLVTAFDSCRDAVRVEYDAGGGWKPMKKISGWSWTASDQLRGGRVLVRATDSAGEEWTSSSSFTAGAARAVTIGSDWPVWGGNADNRRCAREKILPPLQTAWHAQVGGRPCQPVLAAGRLYVATAAQDFEENNALVCLDAADGRELWRAPLEGCPMGPAAVAGEVVAVVDGHGRGYGFAAADGSKLWRTEGLVTYTSYGASAGITAADGVFLAGNAQALEARTGKKLWKESLPLSQNAICPPAISGGRAVGAGTGWQQCAEVATGKVLWKATPSSYRATVGLEDGFLIGGRTIVGSVDGKAGRGFKMSTGSAGGLSADGKVFVAANHPGQVMAQDLIAGKLLWKFPTAEKMSLSDATVSGDLVWVWGSDGFLRALELASGREVWKRRFGSRLSGAVVSGNALFVSGQGGAVFALVGTAGN